MRSSIYLRTAFGAAARPTFVGLAIATFVVMSMAACGGGDSAGSGSPANGGGGVSFGGAQDMGQFRSILDNGELPGEDSLDANGFFNEHYNDAPTADCGGTLCLTPGLTVARDWLTGTHQATLQIAVNTPLDPSSFERLPMNLVVVVDHSGSMAEDNRLDKVKLGLHTLVDNLRAEDRISLISFDDVVTTDAGFTDTLDREALHAAIDKLRPRGSTNIYAGLEAGFQALGEYPTNERQNRVIFLSDGLATVGITDDYSIMAMAKERISAGIGLTTVGVGSSFDVELMRGLAENGAGNYYFLEDGAAAGEVFTEELDYFMTPLALDIDIEATAGAGWTLSTVYGTRLWRASGSHGSMELPAAFVASRTSQNPGEGRRGGGSMIFIALRPTGTASAKVADLTLSYRMPGTTERITQKVSLDYGNDPLATPDEPYLSSAEMAERFAMYNMFLGLHYATQQAPSCAAAGLRATKANALAWNTHHEDPDIAADLVLVDQYLENLYAAGATREGNLDRCPAPGSVNADYYDDDHHGMYCSSSRPTAGWLVILGAALIAVRRRRR
jgi:Ca-activated chloride channel family protein